MPAAQDEHVVAPEEAENMPAGQLTQTPAWETPPVEAEYVPAEQLEQEVDPAAAENLPAAQLIHAVETVEPTAIP